jgi:site-specific recombinase XerD
MNGSGGEELASVSVGRDVSKLVVAQVGRLKETGLATCPFTLLDAVGEEIVSAGQFFRELTACDCSPATVSSYALALQRWLRFLAAIEVAWNRATRAEVVDFVLWMRQARKPGRAGRNAGLVNPLTRKPYPGTGYAPATIDHNLAVVKEFYSYHLAGDGPPVNPVPLVKTENGERLNAHHNPLQPFQAHRRAPLRQRRPPRVPKAIPDGQFNELFARMTSHRDRALLAFFVSTGARAAELIGAEWQHVSVGDQVIAVRRKGTRALQWLPASPDAFIWLRLYRRSLPAEVKRGPGDSVWVTLRRPFAPVTYDAVRMAFNRANAALGSNWTLHDLRHTAARRMIDDPGLEITDVQWILGHAHLSTTEIYTAPDRDEVIGRVLLHHRAGRKQPAPPPAPPGPSEGYRPEVLQALLGSAGDPG